jgi:cytosine/adenosine deaminase-related metal-dependent hydrolase
MNVLLKGLRWNDRSHNLMGGVRIAQGTVREAGESLTAKKEEIVRNFDNHFIYPGLINSHDHLEMNLYPKLGKPFYKNYVQWANDIYKPAESPIREIEKVNIKDRLLWGGLKNLISGVTMVVHHNPPHRFLQSEKFPVKVLKKMAWSHSLAFGRNIEKNFPAKKNVPFIIHAAEGVDDFAAAEILKLADQNLLKKNTVLIHAVGIGAEQIQKIIEHKSSIVWCPSSNLYMFGTTCPIDKIKTQIPVALGSDSTLTGSPTLLQELAVAYETGMATSRELFDMVTSIPSNLFSLPTSHIAAGHPANFFVARAKSDDYFENLCMLTPSDIVMVLVGGKIRLSDSKDARQLKYEIQIGGNTRFSDFDIRGLLARIGSQVGEDTINSPLWKLFD